MSDNEEPKICQACSDFEPQTWRKSLCKNCFHTLDEHSAELLANEAAEVAKEKSAAQAKAKPAETATELKEESVELQKEEPDGKASSSSAKRKYGAARVSGEGANSWSWAKDLGQEYKKPAKPPLSVDTAKGAQGISPGKTTTASLTAKSNASSKSPVATSTSSANKTSPTSTQAPTAKHSPTSTTSSSTKTPPSATSLTSSISSSSPSTKSSVETVSESTTAKATASATHAPEAASTPTSKAKNFASKFESKASEVSKSKTSKPPDIRPGSASVSALIGKSSESSSEAKSQLKQQQAADKVSDQPKSSPTKQDSSKSPKKLSESSKITNVASKFTKTDKNYEDVKTINNKDLKKNTEDGKDKLSTLASSKFDKISKFTLPSKTAPFGKDLLKNSKESTKLDKPKASSTNSPDSSKKVQSSDSITTKENKTNVTKGENGAVGCLASPGDSEMPESQDAKQVRQNASITGSCELDHNTSSITGSCELDHNTSREPTACGVSESQKTDNSHTFQSQVSPDSISTIPEVLVAQSTHATPLESYLVPQHACEQLSAEVHTDAKTYSSSDTIISGESEHVGTLKVAEVEDDTKKSLIESSQPSEDADSANKDENSVASIVHSAAESSQDIGQESADQLNIDLKEKEEKLCLLSEKLSMMETMVKELEKERTQSQKDSSQQKREDLEAVLNELRAQLSQMEEQCSKLEKDNQALMDRLHNQEPADRNQDSSGNTSENVLEEDLEAAEKELEEVREENKELQRHIMEMKNEMDEMYDHFRENEHDEFKEIQKELELTAKNCRVLQFKLRKAERRNEQVEQDRIQYEEKLRRLQDKFDSQDAKDHIRMLEEELRMAKEVSVRLHDELDLTEDKRNKALEENRHLTELLEHTDKRQFRLEMEIDKLRDIVADLKQQLKEARNDNKRETPDRKPPIGSLGKQGSREYDSSQLMKDLYDCMERENDLKDQLKFTEEEAKMMRKRVSEMDEENENLRLQLQRMSQKVSKHKKKEQERQKELDEERKQSEVFRTALSSRHSQDTGEGELSGEVILIVGPEGSQVLEMDEPIPISHRKDSTDEDLMNVMQLRIHLEMLDQELMTSHKKLDEMDLENENLLAEVKFLQERLAEKESQEPRAEPSTPNAYYEDRLRELGHELDELRWKLIEKDRELERLTAVNQTRHSREHSHRKGEKLKKSKSLEESEGGQADLKKQLERAQGELVRLKIDLELVSGLNSELRTENEDLKTKSQIPCVHADDAAIENIELKETVKKMEELNRVQSEKILTLSESLQRLTREPRTCATIATSPTIPGTLSIPGIPLVGPATQTARAAGSESANPREDSNRRDLQLRLHVLQQENEELRKLMEGQGVTGGATRESRLTPGTTQHGPGSDAPTRESPQTKTAGANSPSGQSTLRLCSPVSGGVQAGRSTPTDENRSHGDTVGDAATSTEAGHTHKTMDKSKDSKKPGEISPALDVSSDEHEKATDSTLPESQQCGEDPRGSSKGASAAPKAVTKEETAKAALSDYPEGKSKVVISGTESRVELMEKVLEMDEEISEIINLLRQKEEENDRLKREVKGLSSQLRELKDESRRTELDLLQELDMLHDKNCVMSNLLDIINERAEAAEEELEKRLQEETSQSAVRSASNVSQVSALSDTSMGSDEVFLSAHISKEGVITRDWETKLKIRIESLERLLAEERQKVATADKKLLLAAIDSVSPSVTDDVKLRIREKELLQEELLKSQRHLHIATDQIQGLKERLNILEDQHQRLKADYARLYDELDKPLDKEDEAVTDQHDPDKSEELPLVAERISLVEAPKLQELKDLNQRNQASKEDIGKLEEELEKYRQKAKDLEEELERYKQKTKELEYKVEETDDVWRSKSAASDKERVELEQQLSQRINQIICMEQTLENLKREISAKDKIIMESNAALREKERELSLALERSRADDGDAKKFERQERELLTQLSQRDQTIRTLHDTLRTRDERLKEKDEILHKLNSGVDDQKRDLLGLADKMRGLVNQLQEKEAEISNLKTQLSTTGAGSREASHGCQTDVEKENVRMKEFAQRLQADYEKSLADKRSLEAGLEQSRRSLEDAMMMWDKHRNSLQRDANILEEKVRMYEAFNTMDKDETVEALKAESQTYFQEKESLVCELSSLKLKLEAQQRHHQEQVAKLQAELTDKLRLLRSEVDNNSQMNTEVNRLKRQAEMAFRLQQEQRLLKAEHQATKVRYETRLDKMTRELNKMLLTIEQLQKERELDKQIIQSMQINMSSVKDSYTEELLRSQETEASLHRYVQEIEESRLSLEQLQKQTRELREQAIDQDRLRSELINKLATERSSWQMERANLNSQLNLLEEQMNSSSRQQERSKDIQVNMGMTWEKERREQRRLLAEAHTLALDLQEQLRARDEAFAHERKELLQQVEQDRVTWVKDKRETDRKILEFESLGRKAVTFEKRLKDMQEKADKDLELWRKEKMDLVRLVSEARLAHVQDTKQVETVLSTLIRLRELGSMLMSQSKLESSEGKPPDIGDTTQQILIDYVKEAVLHISEVNSVLSLITSQSPDNQMLMRRISSSEIELLRQEVSSLQQATSDSINQPVTTPAKTEKQLPESHRPSITTTSNTNQPGNNSGGSLSESSKISAGPTVLPGITSTTTHKPVSSFLTKNKTPCVLHPPDASLKNHDRFTSYASGTRSAQSSRAATPEALDFLPVSSNLRANFFPEATQNQTISHSLYLHKQNQKKSESPFHETSIQKRPMTFVKSLSIDGATIPESDNTIPPQLSISANNTPTQPVTSADIISAFSTPSVITSTNKNLLTTSRTSAYSNRVSPRTARRKFFENFQDSSVSPENPIGYQSWPARKSMNVSPYIRQTSLPDPEEVRREAEEEHDLVSSKLESLGRFSKMKSSTSWDEQMHHKNTGQDENIVTSHGAMLEAQSSSEVTSESQTLGKEVSKEKRKRFKKGMSLESTIGTSLAQVSVAVIPPAVPTGFTSSELFAAVKGKLKPVFKKKLGDSGSRIENPSSLNSQAEIISQSQGAELDSGASEEAGPSHSETLPSTEAAVAIPDKRLSESLSSDLHFGKWRSKSAERAVTSVGVHGDIIRPKEVWKFNETAV